MTRVPTGSHEMSSRSTRRKVPALALRPGSPGAGGNLAARASWEKRAALRIRKEREREWDSADKTQAPRMLSFLYPWKAWIDQMLRHFTQRLEPGICWLPNL